MTPEKQRIAIEEACGWIFDHINRSAMYYVPATGSHVGDPLNDLNAMHEAEKSIRKPGLGLWCDYTRCLRRVCSVSLYSDVHATAAQKAEAFLRTIGKWEDEQ